MKRISRMASRILAGLLVFAMLVGMIPTTAFAAAGDVTSRALTEATSLSEGKEYVIVSNGEAMGNKTGSYSHGTNSSVYEGFKAETFNSSADTVPEDLIWTVSFSGNGIKLKNKAQDQYVGVSYDSSTKTYKIGFVANESAAAVWNYNSQLLACDNSNDSAVQNRYLANYHGSDIADNHTFVLRSNSNNVVSAVYFYEVSDGTSVTPPVNPPVNPNPGEDVDATLTLDTTPDANADYVIVSNNEAMGNKTGSYTHGTNSSVYEGLKAETFNSNATTVSEDLIWTLVASGNGFKIKNKANDQYLAVSYESSTKTYSIHFVANAADAAVWTYSSELLACDNSNDSAVQNRYLANYHGSDIADKHTFVLRSNSNDVVAPVYFYAVAEGTTEPPVTPGPGEDDGNDDVVPGEGSNIGFTSDVHGNISGLETWLTNVQKAVDPDLDYMVYGGDYSYNMSSISTYLPDFQNIVAATNRLVGNGKGIYTAGNHEYYFNTGVVTTLDSGFTNTPGFKIVGKAAETSDYIIYNFGASKYSNEGEFVQKDIDQLASDLAAAAPDKAIFVVSHYPLHNISGRTPINAKKVIDVLNDYPNAIFLWGHNHSQSGETNYGKILTAGQSLTYASGQSAKIEFTYASLGALYEASASKAPYQGLVANVNEDEVTFTYYDKNGNTAGTSTKIEIETGTPVARYNITASAGAGGSIDPNGTVSVREGGSQTFTVTANRNYEVDTVTVDGKAAALTNGKYTFNNVTANHTISVTFKALPVDDTGKGINLGFTSDVHGEIAYLESWLTNVQDEVSPDLAYMAYAGDYSYNMSSVSEYLKDFQKVVDATNELVGNGKGIYTAGNHEYYFYTGTVTTLDKGFTDTPGFTVVGEAAKTNDYIIYNFGASKYNDSGEFEQSQIDKLDSYLATAPDDKPIFVVSHYPLHSLTSGSTNRTPVNADKVIDVLNKYPNVIFFWGHNHSQGPETNYGKVLKAGASISYASNQSKKINFTYASIGAMNHSQDPYDGVVANVDGNVVTLTYYSNNGTPSGTTTVEIDQNAVKPDPDQPTTVPVTGVTLSPRTATLDEGATITLTATVAPSNATNKTVTWKSSDTAVATVSNSGVVTAVAEGTATITVTTAEGNFTATCTVTVNGAVVEPEVVPVTGVTLNVANAELTVGGTITLAATVAPADATNKNVTWSSSNTAVATVDNTGKVTAVAEGTATITVTTVDGSKTATCAVTVNAAPVIPDPKPPVVNPFVDVKENDYFYAPVLWAVENGVTTGYTTTEFAPDMSCTRAQAVTFLWRAAGNPEPKTTVNPFTDVAANEYYYKAVLWAVENEITTGYTTTTFEPDMSCTRAQIVTFIWRMEGKEAPETDVNPFVDVAEDAYYYDAVLWAVENEITTGYTATTFEPDMNCTRAQIVTFLYREFGKENE